MLVLASASPRRSALLKQIGLDFVIRVSDIEEKTEGENPAQVVMHLASQKAKDIVEKLKQEGIVQAKVVGADTIVACDGKILGKPKDGKEAAAFLKLLSGKAHQVYTGISFWTIKEEKSKEICYFEETKVYMRELSDKEIAEYIETGEPMDKAGAYGIQGIGARYIKGIEGDYNNVVGLPLCRLYNLIKEE